MRNLLLTVGLFTTLISTGAYAQQSGIKRTDLQKHDIGIPGYETIQARIDLEPGTAVGMHAHPGEEVIYVLEGLFEYQIEGDQPVVLKAGDVLFIPAGKNHSAKNIGKVQAAELATYIVRKDKPLLIFKK
ncbi:cupin domain-containing protein [Chryseobacterium sp. CBSDS_008]|uniref:cupin domain-containing protein n=1 Tax=Chryseobacterium sp. CBSDS_008 TaxID=3415265 RepID=UPI003CFBBB09